MEAQARGAGGNKLEDEFAGVPSPRRRLPWPALVVVLLSAYLIYHQRNDIAYALSGSSPRNLGPAAALFAPNAAPLPENRYVRVEGVPDFESAVVLDTQGEWKFRSFFRLLNTGGRLFVQRMPGPLPSDVAEQGSFAGRLVPLSNVSFSDAIRGYYAKHVAATHVFERGVVQSALQQQQLPGPVRDRVGADVTLGANDVLAFDVREPQRFKIELPQEIYTQLANARKAVESTGARVHGEGASVPRDTGAGAFAFTVEVLPESETAVLSAIADLASRARIEPVVRTLEARVADVADRGGAVAISRVIGRDASAPPAPQQIPWDHVVGVRTSENLEIPKDAYLLLEGEKPGSQMRAVIAAAFLLAFAAVNILAFRRL